MGEKWGKFKLAQKMDETWWKCSPTYTPHILKIWSKNINHNPSYKRLKPCNVIGDAS